VHCGASKPTVEPASLATQYLRGCNARDASAAVCLDGLLSGVYTALRADEYLPTHSLVGRTHGAKALG